MLREHLSKLLGLPAESIAVDPESMPELPAISQDDDLPARAVENSLAVKQAEQKVAAAEARAKGEHKALTMAHHRFGVAVRLPRQVQQLRSLLS